MSNAVDLFNMLPNIKGNAEAEAKFLQTIQKEFGSEENFFAAAGKQLGISPEHVKETLMSFTNETPQPTESTPPATTEGTGANMKPIDSPIKEANPAQQPPKLLNPGKMQAATNSFKARGVAPAQATDLAATNPSTVQMKSGGLVSGKPPLTSEVDKMDVHGTTTDIGMNRILDALKSSPAGKDMKDERYERRNNDVTPDEEKRLVETQRKEQQSEKELEEAELRKPNPKYAKGGFIGGGGLDDEITSIATEGASVRRGGSISLMERKNAKNREAEVERLKNKGKPNTDEELIKRLNFVKESINTDRKLYDKDGIMNNKPKPANDKLMEGKYAEGGKVDEDLPMTTEEEQADDIPIMASEGEFMMPAYAVKYYGEGTLQHLLETAKEKMQTAEDSGDDGYTEGYRKGGLVAKSPKLKGLASQNINMSFNKDVFGDTPESASPEISKKFHIPRGPNKMPYGIMSHRRELNPVAKKSLMKLKLKDGGLITRVKLDKEGFDPEGQDSNQRGSNYQMQEGNGMPRYADQEQLSRTDVDKVQDSVYLDKIDKGLIRKLTDDKEEGTKDKNVMRKQRGGEKPWKRDVSET